MAAEFLQAAIDIGERLCDTAEWSGDTCSWSGLMPVQVSGGFRHERRPLGPTIYNGAAGNALFLDALARVTGHARPRECAAGAVRYALAHASSVPAATRASFYSGVSGIAYAAVVAGGDAERSEGWKLLKKITAASLRSQPAEVLLGIAGVAGALLCLPRKAWIAAAVERVAETLLAMSRVRGGLRSWPPFGPLSDLHRDDLTGFAHGASGPAWALLEAGCALERPEWIAAAEEAFAYERRWVDALQDNWLDLRYMPGPAGNINDGKVCQIQWCHGAAGIGLVRLRAYALLRKREYLDEAAMALRAVSRDLELYPHNWQPNFSLCHGVAGNAELLLASDEPGHLLLAERLARTGIERHARGAWPSALSAEEIPALLTGTAGTGLFYLRLYDRDAAPNILLLTPRQPRPA